MIGTFYINNTHIARKIRIESLLNVSDFALVSRRDGRIESEFRLQVDDENIRREGVTYIDMMIADAVYSLYKTEQTAFSEGMILRTLSGDDKQTCRKEIKERIRSSLDKMAKIDFTLDCEEEMRERGIEEFDNIEDEKFISLRKLKSGKYENTNPPLYQYAERVKQIITIPYSLWSLDQKKPVNDSLENLALKHYLLLRIAVANYETKNYGEYYKRLKNLNKIFYYHPAHKSIEEGKYPFTGMLFDLGVVKEWEKNNGKLTEVSDGDTEEIRSRLSGMKNRTHKNTIKILDSLREMKFIENYELLKGVGKEIIGVSITGSVTPMKKYK